MGRGPGPASGEHFGLAVAVLTRNEGRDQLPHSGSVKGDRLLLVGR